MQAVTANPFYSGSSPFNGVSNPVTVTGTDAYGNVEGVTASGVKVLADPNGTMVGYMMSDVLTPADKLATGFDPSSHMVNPLADALASYRAAGTVKGDVSPDFIAALKTSLATTGGYPANPAALMAKGAAPPALTQQTLSALFSMLGAST